VANQKGKKRSGSIGTMKKCHHGRLARGVGEKVFFETAFRSGREAQGTVVKQVFEHSRQVGAGRGAWRLVISILEEGVLRERHGIQGRDVTRFPTREITGGGVMRSGPGRMHRRK